MFIDYVTVMLVNMVAGLAAVALLFIVALDAPVRRHWATALGVPGLIAFCAGLIMTVTWPLGNGQPPLTWANVAFGELTLLFGALLLGAAVSIAFDWDLLPLGIAAFVGGLTAIIVGWSILHLGLTRSPTLAAIGFLLTGLGGVLTPLVLALRRVRPIRWAVGAILLVAAGIWLFIGLMSYQKHIKRFSTKPAEGSARLIVEDRGSPSVGWRRRSP